MIKRVTDTLKKDKQGNSHDENQYINLIHDILNEGEFINGRNGKVKTVIGSAMHFSLKNNTIPLLTTKKVAWKTCLKELFWFISGSTDNSILQNQNVKIWNGNSSREYLDSVGLNHLAENDLGPVYGHQWRYFNAKYINKDTDYSGQGIDQLNEVINLLKDPEKRYSRRIIMSSWNPCQLKEMALPPCHILCHFNVIGNKLSCILYQRSCDVGLGVPFNIASYSFLTHLLAKHCNLEAEEFIYYLGNCHIYDDHLEKLKSQTEKTPFKFPILKIKERKNNIENYTLEDFEIKDYKHHETIKMNMRN